MSTGITSGLSPWYSRNPNDRLSTRSLNAGVAPAVDEDPFAAPDGRLVPPMPRGLRWWICRLGFPTAVLTEALRSSLYESGGGGVEPSGSHYRSVLRDVDADDPLVAGRSRPGQGLAVLVPDYGDDSVFPEFLAPLDVLRGQRDACCFSGSSSVGLLG